MFRKTLSVFLLLAVTGLGGDAGLAAEETRAGEPLNQQEQQGQSPPSGTAEKDKKQATAPASQSEGKDAGQTVIPPPSAPEAREPAPALVRDGAGDVVQPAPLPVAGEGRDPFTAPPKKIFTPDYGKGLHICRLRGVCKVGTKQVGIFSASEKAGQAAAGEQLQLVAVGEQIRFFAENSEYILTVRELGARSAVLVGENQQIYKVYM